MNKSQAQLILEALQDGQTITPMDALNRWGCFRLGARIFDLRKKGYDIVNVGRDDQNYACYKLRYPNPIPNLPPPFPKSVEESQQQLFP